MTLVDYVHYSLLLILWICCCVPSFFFCVFGQEEKIVTVGCPRHDLN